MQKETITLVLLPVIVVVVVFMTNSSLFLQHNQLQYALYGAGVICFLSLTAVAFYHLMGKTAKKYMFTIMSLVIIGFTAFLVSTSLYQNYVSPFHGPVHWHAEVSFSICGKDYKIASHDIGTDKPLHTHGESWVHIETTPINTKEVELHHFFEDIGGGFNDDYLSFPTDAPGTEPGTKDETITVRTGDLCGSVPGTLKMYVNDRQEEKMGHYVIAPLEAGNIDKIKIVFG